MSEFSLLLALTDYIPVLAFGASVIIIGKRFGSLLFVLGAMITLLAGVMKASWKLIMAVKKRDIKWMNRAFVPAQSVGFMIILLSVLLNLGKIQLTEILCAVSGMPQLIFYILWLIFMLLMIWYRKTSFDRYNARSNAAAQTINCAFQLSLLLGLLFTR